jgi:spermidine/putrescine transport system ATP-binding protein
MIGGFEEPSAGTIYLGGKDVTGLPAYRRDVNTVFQSYALFPHLSIYENIAFGLRRKKTDKGDVDRRVKEALQLVDLRGTRSASRRSSPAASSSASRWPGPW